MSSQDAPKMLAAPGGTLPQKPQLLVVDDDPEHVELTSEALERDGYRIDTATSGEEGMKKIASGDYDVIITDLKLGDRSGLEILKGAKLRYHDSEVVVVTGFGSVDSALAAWKEGALTYLQKPVNLESLRSVIRAALERKQLRRNVQELRQRLEVKWGFDKIVGDSAPLRRLFNVMQQISPTDATVLITGDSGTGKELVAQAIHNNSLRRQGPFVALNCAALSEGILESELFGHEKGAFTGAIRQHRGRFEHAHTGTLFLDEVGDMPLTVQVKLFRVLETREVYRVGSNAPIPVDVRLIAATNKNLAEEVKAKRFREELYFRLRVVALEIPPLRDRREDIPLLATSFMKESAERHGKPITGIDPLLLQRLYQYPWPGNVRELKNCIENMVIMCQKYELNLDDLPDYLGKPAPDAPISFFCPGLTMEQAEKELIRKTLEATKGNREKAAKILAIGERTLYRKIKQYQL